MIRLGYSVLSVIVALIVVSTIPFVLSYESTTGNLNQPSTGDDFIIPSWIKNNAGWWADDLIDDSSFVSGLQWMISNDVIVLSPTEQGVSDGENIIPSWIKKTAGWWAGDEIHDVTFVSAIKYLIGEGIIIIEQEVEEVEESAEVVEELKEFHMIVNDHGCIFCTNWAHVGEEYHFHVEIFDEFRGNPIDGVTITAKIISKDGELRHDFGAITTEDGIYSGSIVIPNIDWYAGNIFSVTAAHNGFEKTIEKEFEVFNAQSGNSGVTMVGAGDCALVPPISLTQNGKPQGLAFSSDGTKMYTTGNPGADDGVWYYELDGPYCIATASFVEKFRTESADSTPTGVAFNPTGTKMFVVGKGSNPGDVYEYDLSTRWIPSSATLSYSFTVTEDNSPEDIHFNSNGKKMFIIGSQSDEVHQYTLSTPYELFSADHDYSLSVTSQEGGPAGIHFNPTGTKMFIVGNTGKEVNQYTLSTPFVLSSADHDSAFSVSSQEVNARAIWFDNTGKKMFVIGFAGDDINVYKLTVPFVLSSASFVS